MTQAVDRIGAQHGEGRASVAPRRGVPPAAWRRSGSSAPTAGPWIRCPKRRWLPAVASSATPTRAAASSHADRARGVGSAHASSSAAPCPPSARRANLMVERLQPGGPAGRVLRVGSCRLRILGETRPCERMDEAFDGLREAMKPRWGGGAFAEVLDDGLIAVGERWAGGKDNGRRERARAGRVREARS